MTFIHAIVTNPILFTSLVAGLAASIVSGIVGSYVVIKRIAFISGSIAHSVLGGIGISLWLERSKGVTWLSPIHGALVAAVLSALIIGWIRLHYREREDSVIAVLWSLGMAIGVIFIAQTPGYNVELTNFLIGNILWVTPRDLLMLCLLDGVVIVTVCMLHKRFLVLCFDEEQALLQGISVKRLYLLLLILIAITVVLLIHVVGIILVIAMLIIPPSIANIFTCRLSRMMAIAIGLNAVFCLSGTAIAYQLDWPTGATIALVASAAYLLSLASTSHQNS